jgi:hypothetical protein
VQQPCHARADRTAKHAALAARAGYRRGAPICVFCVHVFEPFGYFATLRICRGTPIAIPLACRIHR